MIYERIFKEVKENEFTKDFIQTIALWQNYGISSDTDKFILKLKELKVPKKFKICSNDLYRVMVLEKDFFESIQKENKKLTTLLYSSWSLELQSVNEYMKSYYFNDILSEVKNPQIVIFKHKPKSSEVFLNLHLLWNDKLFIKTIEEFESKGIYFNEGLELNDSQKEVILHSVNLDKTNIFKTIS